MADSSSLESLAVILPKLRAMGVKTFKSTGADFDVEFFPTMPAADESPMAPKTMLLGSSLEEKCPCGHGLETEHNELGCLHGCEMTTCAKSKTE